MIQMIVGREGKGKTAKLLDKVNSEVKEATGNYVFLDKNKKHMYELNNKVRLIDVSEFDFECYQEFYGFICGIISQDHDLEKLFLDNFLKIAAVDDTDIESVLTKFNSLSQKCNIDFVISVSKDENELPAIFKDNIIISL